MRRKLPLLGLVLLGVSTAPFAIAKGAAGEERPKVAAALPSGGKELPPGAPYERSDTVHEAINADGETVYSVSPSRFDVSPPLSELAKTMRFEELTGEEGEGPENPPLPDFRRIRSDLKDPVVQPAPRGESLASVVPGFNFLGVGTNGLTPSDCNGSVGSDQFVETVNTRYQVWSLNRATKVATSVLGPISINTLWSGFGGACETQNSGDPIVLYDKLANRWLISQFTSSNVGGVYYQCVALSTTASATGTFYRYAFAVPSGWFGDYPHFGAWQNAYYMMAHAFSGGYVGAIFAAMDRTKMLAGDPTALWVVMMDPQEGGHMPADLDGFAPPPFQAPGLFLSLHSEGMYLYRLRPSFVGAGSATRTVQGIVPLAPFSAACGGGSCIPQPGTTVRVGSLADRLMFRAAYRNFVDHESVVVSHSVDPGVSGVVSGVRWYDIRLSGNPDATCPSYPCLYQQGTIADVPGGRSRWMSSLAMDGAENLLVGYSTTGLTAGSDNHSIRYTGRARTDPPGTMTVPEGVIATGTANNTNSRWGDYTSMSADPFDDCTLWYVNQYFTAAGSWSTRVASASFPSGSGAGQCPPTACTTRPTFPPGIGAATVVGDNQVRVNWTVLGPVPGSWTVERAEGTCASPGLYRPLGRVPGTQNDFVDTTVQGGFTYAYRVRGATDAEGRCQALTNSGCVQATATGTCSLPPSFAGAQSAASAAQASCGIQVSWTPGTSGCPLTPNLRYNVYRGTTPDFVPSAANRVADCVSGTSDYLDQDAVASGVTYFYVVRAEDESTGNGGACGGNEEHNAVAVAGTAYGPGVQSTAATWTDGGGDTTALLHLNAAEAGNTGDLAWRFVRTADDAGANHTPGGAYAYRNTGPGPAAAYESDQCVEVQTPPLTVAAGTVNLRYWERHQMEYHWDGVAVEYSVNGGPWIDVPLPSNDPGVGCAAGDDVTGMETLSCTQSPPINGCGYGAGKRVFTGPLLSGTSCNDWTTGPVTAYAHRCHAIPGFTGGQTVRFRWRFTSDPALVLAGFYLDDVAVSNARLPNACTAQICAGQPDGTACDDGDPCTAGESCAGGACLPGTPIPPPAEVAGLVLKDATGTTLSWTAGPAGLVYDVAGGNLDDLRTSGTAAAICLSNDGSAASSVDGRANPAAGSGYYYLVRAQSACGSGSYGLDSASVERSLPAACP
ncbi:MAG TPA: hypothetical protein VFV75_16750 [Candidatus Polarisedimenticolaceae bacterium]|nr:hypothetical protein [Candidatus Polarisedimenticolaceae bacterium]